MAGMKPYKPPKMQKAPKSSAGKADYTGMMRKIVTGSPKAGAMAAGAGAAKGGLSKPPAQRVKPPTGSTTSSAKKVGGGLRTPQPPKRR